MVFTILQDDWVSEAGPEVALLFNERFNLLSLILLSARIASTLRLCSFGLRFAKTEPEHWSGYDGHGHGMAGCANDLQDCLGTAPFQFPVRTAKCEMENVDAVQRGQAGPDPIYQRIVLVRSGLSAIAPR
jgi:hypothetical protein